ATLQPQGSLANQEASLETRMYFRWWIVRSVARCFVCRGHTAIIGIERRSARSTLPIQELLELLCDADVNEPARGVVGKARITDGVSAFTEGLRRILIKDIVASHGDAEAIQRS